MPRFSLLPRRRWPRGTLALALIVLLASPVTDAAAACSAQWSVQPGPTSEQVDVRDLAVLRGGEVWAVGVGPASGAIAHHDDGRWTVENVDGSGYLGAVAGRAGAVWAVGADPEGRPLIVHRTPSGWRTVHGAPARSTLSSVSVSSARNVWIGGVLYDEGFRHSRALALHFDGVRWQRHVLPGFGDARGFGVGTAGPDDTWVVGDAVAQRTSDLVAWHWNGRAWRREVVQRGDPRGAAGSLLAVRTRPAGSTWTVGFVDAGDCCHAFATVARRTDRGWQRLTMPDRLVYAPARDLLVDDRRGLVTVVGEAGGGDGGSFHLSPVFETYDGATWRSERVSGLPADASGSSGWRAIDGDGRGGAWVVGHLGTQQIFAQRCR